MHAHTHTHLHAHTHTNYMHLRTYTQLQTIKHSYTIQHLTMYTVKDDVENDHITSNLVINNF